MAHSGLCSRAASTASLFVQMSLRTQRSSTNASAQPILDLLIPVQASKRIRATRSARPGSRISLRAYTSGRQEQGSFQYGYGLAMSRGFATTTTKRATLTSHNPQTDDEGNEMRLDITPRAAKRLSEIMVKDNNPNLALRIQVESGGCHGFQYLMRFITLPTTESSPEDVADGPAGTLSEDDTVFAYSPDGTQLDDHLPTPKVVLDTPSLELLKGSKVDFTMELIGSQFKIVDNPLATSSCGCGTSFDIKI